MAKPNYGYEKRQRELAKKSKKEEKLRRKTQGGAPESGQAVTDEASAGEQGAPHTPESPEPPADLPRP